MKKICTVFLFSFVTASIAGCAMNPFADDNIYGTRNTKDNDPTTKGATGADERGTPSRDSDPSSGGRGAN